jgi:hypothetical protein
MLPSRRPLSKHSGLSRTSSSSSDYSRSDSSGSYHSAPSIISKIGDSTHSDRPGPPPEGSRSLQTRGAGPERAAASTGSAGSAASGSLQTRVPGTGTPRTGSRAVPASHRPIQHEVEFLTTEHTPENIARVKRVLGYYKLERESVDRRLSGQPSSSEVRAQDPRLFTRPAPPGMPSIDRCNAFDGVAKMLENVRLKESKAREVEKDEQKSRDLRSLVPELEAVLERTDRPEEFRKHMFPLREILMLRVANP